MIKAQWLHKRLSLFLGNTAKYLGVECHDASNYFQVALYRFLNSEGVNLLLTFCYLVLYICVYVYVCIYGLYYIYI